MDKQNRPKAFGVFKPVNHVLMAFRNETDLHAAETALSQQGFTEQDMTSYEPQEMLRQADEDIRNAGILANIGQELNLVKAHRDFAEAGCSFLAVHVGDDEAIKRAADIARQTHAASAQHYGRFVIEELISSPRGEQQVFESPERGLDLHVPGQPKH
ncbi:MAG: hypothetical protein QM749_04895 [Aquabacterium sp.]